MAGQLQRLLRPEHPRPRAELVLALAVVEPRIAARDEQEQMIAGADRQRLGDPARLDAERLRGRLDRRRALLDFDQRQVGRICRQPRADRIRGSFADQVQRDLALRRVAAVLEQENALPGAEQQPCRPRPGSRAGLRSARCAGARACRRALRRHARSRRSRARCARNRLQVAPRGRRGILLDQERGRGVAAENVSSLPRCRCRARIRALFR